jgi:hypothetical protein
MMTPLLIVINATCLALFSRDAFDGIDANASVVLVDEPATETWRLHRHAAAIVAPTAALVIVDCSSHQRVAVAFHAMPMGLDCAIAHIDRLMTNATSFIGATKRVVANVDAWQREAHCRLPPDIVLASVFYAAAWVIFTSCAFARRLWHRDSSTTKMTKKSHSRKEDQ